MKRSSTHGFTLVEILFVVATLTLLAGILLPALAAARVAARQGRCLSNLRQLALAHQAYAQDYDEALPPWQIDLAGSPRIWTDFLRPYYKEASLLSQGFTAPEALRQSAWAADYVMCTWGPGGDGTRLSPYWRWPGAPEGDADAPRPMVLAEVRRPAETLQFIDGFTTRAGSAILSFHPNGARNGAFLDGHAHVIRETEWNQVSQDEGGYFYRMAAADR